MKMRVLTLCLIALIPLSVFATGGSQDTAGAGVIQVSGPGELPIVEEQVTVTIMAERHAQITSMSDNYATRYMEEQTNVHIEWLDTPMAEFDEKLNLVLASGEYPDAIMDFNVAADLVVRYGSEGIFVPLNDLIQEHSPNLLQMFEKNPTLKNLITAPDGNIYGFPAVNDNYNGMFRSKMWINSSWLETLGLAMPTTTEEFYNVLRAFKEDDHHGNGIQDEIPLSGMTNYDYMRVPSFLMNAFVYWNASGPVKGLTIENGQMAFAPITNAWREGLRYYHMLYNEELLDPAAFTQKQPEIAQLGENPDDMILGAAPSNWWGKIVQRRGESERYRLYDSVPPLTGPEGIRTAAYYGTPDGTSGIIRDRFLITNQSEYPEVLAKWADFKYSLEGTLNTVFGQEGSAWEWAGADQEAIVGGPALFDQLQLTGDGRWQLIGPVYLPWETMLGRKPAYEDMYTPAAITQRLREETLPFDVGLVDEVPYYGGYYMSLEDSREVAQLQPAINTYLDEAAVRFITGDLDIDSDWDAYVEEYERLHLDRYLELMGAAHDRTFH